MRFVLSLLSIILSCSLSAQQVKFYATVDSKKILQDSYVSVDFILENAEGGNFRPPTFKNFTIAGGPAKSTSMQIVNGKVSQSMSFGYELTPKKAGNLTIEPAAIVVNGKTLRSNKVVVEVVEKKNKVGGNQLEQIFVTLEVSDSIAYIGQQIVLDYKLYTKLDVRGTSYLDKPEYNGFFAEDIKMSRSSYGREIIQGEEYYVKILDKIALFPQQTGKYTLEPIRFNLKIPTGKSTGYFGTTRMKNFTAKTKAQNIVVKEFGADVPDSFSGAVGRYNMNVKGDRNTITQDDAFTMWMSVSGDGDSRTINAPKFAVEEGLDMYDPNIIKDESRSNGNRIVNEKIFEYIIVPKKKGRFKIIPEFSYFDVDSSKFITLKSMTHTLTVAKGTGKSSTKKDEKISKVELAAISENTNLSNIGKPFFNSLPYWMIFIFGGFGALWIVWLKQKQIKEDGIDPLLKRSNLAGSIASARLSKADDHINNGRIKEGFAEISNSLKEYLSDKWHIPYSELNPKKISDLLQEKKFSAEIVAQTDESLSACEMALYAGASAEKIGQVRNQIGHLIESIEKH